MTAYTVDVPCLCGAVSVFAPYNRVDGDQAEIRITVDGTTTTVPIADLNVLDRETRPFCVVTTQPLLPIPCGGP